MASAAQIQANRSNAQKSTGPRTAVGKERASRNALKHGLLAREAVIAGEDPEEFELYREGMLEELAPAGPVEAMLAESAHGGSDSPGPPKADAGRNGSPPWRTAFVRLRRRRLRADPPRVRLRSTLGGDARLEEWKQLKGSEWDRGISGVVDEDAALGKVVVADCGGYRTMAELRKERQARAATVEPEEVSRSEGWPPADQEPVTAPELASFGADVAPGPQTRKNGLGSPEPPAGVAGGTGSQPVVENHGRDARATIFHHSRPVPDAPAEELSCETNPISGGVSGCECQAAGESCETNPISEGRWACLG